MDDSPFATVPGNFAELLAQKIVGQPKALERIVPWVQMYLAGLSPTERPTGVFLLPGPTGTGKTRTVEALAEVLHGDSHKVLRINCGEYQSDHEVAKLIGSPGELTLEENEICKKEGFQTTINKPFFGMDIVRTIESRKQAATAS